MGPIKEVFAPHLGRTVKFGRRRPVARCPRFQMKNYVGVAALPTPPATCDYTPSAHGSLTQVFQNDSLGDCVIAGGYHVIGVATGNAGKIFVPTATQITKDYSAIGGYVPGHPSTDNGCDEQTALNYWTQHGFADGSKLLGWLTLDATNQKEVMTAMWLFENLFFGVELPDAWVNPFPSGNGFKWDVAGAADPDNGHCFIGAGYSSAGVNIDSWGLLGTLTWKAITAYASVAGQGELYVLLTPDQLAKGQTKAPNGFDWTALLTDFNAMGGNVPVPVPTPPAPVPPAPVPSTGVTLAQAQQWAADGLAKSWPTK